MRRRRLPPGGATAPQSAAVAWRQRQDRRAVAAAPTDVILCVQMSLSWSIRIQDVPAGHEPARVQRGRGRLPRHIRPECRRRVQVRSPHAGLVIELPSGNRKCLDWCRPRDTRQRLASESCDGHLIMAAISIILNYRQTWAYFVYTDVREDHAVCHTLLPRTMSADTTVRCDPSTLPEDAYLVNPLLLRASRKALLGRGLSGILTRRTGWTSWRACWSGGTSCPHRRTPSRHTPSKWMTPSF